MNRSINPPKPRVAGTKPGEGDDGASLFTGEASLSSLLLSFSITINREHIRFTYKSCSINFQF
uniref:Uncharacterized protein n=1 Tax=Kalanchoe fedtschenkoi TaxID=63787 RepID=A0A7N0V6Z9_KALFE